MTNAAPEASQNGLFNFFTESTASSTTRRREVKAWTEQWEVSDNTNDSKAAERRFKDKYLGLYIIDDDDPTDDFEGTINDITFHNGREWVAWVRNEGGDEEKYRMGSLPVCIEAAAEMQPEGITLILKHAADMVYPSDDDDIDDVADTGRGASEAADSEAPVPSNRVEETPSEPTTKRQSARLRRK